MTSITVLISLDRLLLLLLLLSLSETSPALSQATVITSLPGFPGQLPFYLETGYIGVGELEEVELFYYFIESGRSPKDDPLLLWLTGGPGCSSLSGILFEIGPITFDYDNSSGNRPVLRLNPYSWTNVANIIFLDQPVGTGFSYSKTTKGYTVDDFSSAQDSYDFLRKWLLAHPKFSSNQLYISGDSYSGKIAPMITLKVAKGNEDGLAPVINLQGYLLGNPVTNELKDINARVRFAYLMALISDELYHSAASNCNGEYMRVDVNNSACRDDLLMVTECISKLEFPQILEPSCEYMSPTPLLGSKWKNNVNLNHLLLLQQPPFRVPAPGQQYCRTYNYLYSYIWANDKTVQEALHVKQGTIKQWVRCNTSLSDEYYIKDLVSSVPYHIELIKRGYRILIYSGDHDMLIPHVATHGWINTLNLTISDDWGPWFVDGQIAGFTMLYEYESGKSLLTYATVKGAGHTAPEYKPKECLAMIRRWLALEAL